MTPVDVVAKFLKVDEGVARVVGGGLFLLAAGALAATWLVNAADLYKVATFVGGFSVLAMVLARMGGVLATLIAWFATLTAGAYVALFMTQFLTNSMFSPPLMRAGCFVAPFVLGCPLAATQVAAAQGSASEQAGAPRPLPPPAEPSVAPAAPTEGRRVFIQFAGGLSRDDVIALAATLTRAGWRIEGGDQGGERISSAFGLNEARFFNPEDAAAAEALAQAVAEAGQPAPRVRDFSRIEARPGHLELWISR